MIIDNQPVSLTSAEPGNTTDIATSLRLSLAWIPSLGADNRITFYASTPGTFVDLAADLTFATSSIAQLSERLQARQKVRVEVPELHRLFPLVRDRRVMMSQPADGRCGGSAPVGFT